MATARELTPHEFAAYRDAARRRHERERRLLAAREERARAVARQVAALRRQFGVERVVVFGSLVHPGCFTPWSNVDIAAWGLRPEETFRAIGVAMECSRDIPVDLVDTGACKAPLLRIIEHEGVPL